MVAEIALAATVLFVLAAEQLHAARVRKIARLAFGPTGKPAPWASSAPFLRIVAAGALAWGIVTLWTIPPRVQLLGEQLNTDPRHLVLILDVSPSMRLKDAGPTGKQTRSARAADLLTSFFERAPIALYKISVVAFYTDAKPVVLEATDMEIIRNILNDLPMHYAFKSGTTNLFAGLTIASQIAKPWKPGSGTVIVVSDGDSIPPTGMPAMPASIAHSLVVGVGDPSVGRYIAGHQSRQDASMLRQAAHRLGGEYHNGNDKHIPSDLLQRMTALETENPISRWTKREYALLACVVGGSILAFLPALLNAFGSNWRPGVPQASKLADTKRSMVPTQTMTL